MNLEKIVTHTNVHVSVPCRIDVGGTLDLSTFYLPMLHLKPASFNIALNLRTHVFLEPYKKGWVKISSKGFESAAFKKDEAPFDHPMGLMFALSKYFDAHGIHIKIESTSPPRSALGGSSAAAVAILSAIFNILKKPVDPKQVAWLAHYIEASVAGVPCGLQDQLAAAFGGVNLWSWRMGPLSPGFEQEIIYPEKKDLQAFNRHILVAYGGVPHISSDINSQWIRSFVKGKTRTAFKHIVAITKEFATALKRKDFEKAAYWMNQETQARLEITPEVLDNTGKKLFGKAMENNCGARFTGAGGGGCIWAVGKKTPLSRLKKVWTDILDPIKHAGLLETKIDPKGIVIHSP